jgi:hypothetical protein
MTEPIDFDNEEIASTSLVKRADWVRKATIVAGANLKIAQHRDTLQYAMRRGGSYKPRVRQFNVGDFVYVRKGSQNSLYPTAGRAVLRAVWDKGNGVWILQGKDGVTVTEQISNMAPCHLPQIDATIVPRLGVVDLHLACERCRFTDNEDSMVLCDSCGTGWHITCLDPPLETVPEGSWVCPYCEGVGIEAVPEDVEKGLANINVGELPKRPANKSDAYVERIKANELLHGKVVSFTETNEETGVEVKIIGKLCYRGVNASKVPFWFMGLERLDAPAKRINMSTGQALKCAAEADDAAAEDVEAQDGGMDVVAYANLIMRSDCLVEEPDTEDYQHDSVGMALLCSPLEDDWQDVWVLERNNVVDYSTKQLFTEVLNALMPGSWTSGHVTALFNGLPGQKNFLQRGTSLYNPGAPECVVTLPEEVKPLLDMVPDIVKIGVAGSDEWVLDPWAGTGVIGKALRRQGARVVTNDINENHGCNYHMNALQPKMYMDISPNKTLPSYIVTSPWFKMLDLAVPIAAASCRVAAFIHVPGHYLTNAPPARLRFFKELNLQRRMALMIGLPRGPVGSRCFWLCIFTSREHMVTHTKHVNWDVVPAALLL